MHQLIPKARISECVIEQFTDVLVPQAQEKLVEMIQLIPQERIRDRVTELIVDTPDGQIREPSVEVVKAMPKRACATAHRGVNRGGASFTDSGNTCRSDSAYSARTNFRTHR